MPKNIWVITENNDFYFFNTVEEADQFIVKNFVLPTGKQTIGATILRKLPNGKFIIATTDLISNTPKPLEFFKEVSN